MIYDFPEESIQIKQGDIVFPVPYILLDDLENIDVILEDTVKQVAWEDIKTQQYSLAAIPLKPVWVIVATQNCDAIKLPYITCFLIESLVNVSNLTLPMPEKYKSWVNFITEQSRRNASWFYLPIDINIGFSERMAINFHSAFEIPRDFLEHNLINLRKGRLNNVAFEHYREKIAQYFRRYPYDEWYPLNRQEFITYNEKRGGTINAHDHFCLTKDDCSYSPTSLC